jgi:uncharacterized protein YndB with AHSA1/START domain
MEHGSIERQIHVGAPPEVVYDLVSDPGHVARWWIDVADFEPAPDRSGVLGWNVKAHTRPTAVHLSRRLGELADYAAELVIRR